MLYLFLALVAAAGAWAQDAKEEPGAPAATAPAETPEGIWPSQKLIKLMLTRWTHEAADKYGLDEQQRARAEEAVVERWTRFLYENRKDVQPLVNEFLEMRMDLTPPSKEKVEDFARRAKPHFDDVAKELDEGTTEFREILRPNQRIKFEIDAAQMKIGVGLATQKFDQWQKGEFDPEDFWEPVGQDPETRRERRRKSREERERQRELAAQKQKELEDASRDQIEIEMDSWQRYAAAFIRNYRLDAGQKDTVLSCLTELRDRAITHRDRNRDEIIRLEERIASSTGDEGELSEIKRQLDRLYGPIDEMFRELKARIEQVPTSDQRAVAQAAQQEEGRTGKAAPIDEPAKTNAPLAIENAPPTSPPPSPSP